MVHNVSTSDSHSNYFWTKNKQMNNGCWKYITLTVMLWLIYYVDAIICFGNDRQGAGQGPQWPYVLKEKA